MAQSATPATQNPTSRHNGGTASQLRKHVRVTDEEDFRVTDEGLSFPDTCPILHRKSSVGIDRRKMWIQRMKIRIARDRKMGIYGSGWWLFALPL